MTLKNEYNQIAARTITYGSTDYDEFNYSTEKLDPTHYTWLKTSTPTFGGTRQLAHNHQQPRNQMVEPHVKNNRFSSVGEIQEVRKASDWENVGQERQGSASTRVLKAITKYFTVDGVRLDPEEEGAHISGWDPAYGTAANASTKTVSAQDLNWEPNIWAGQTMRIHSGRLAGERFPIEESTENSLRVSGYSVPGDKELAMQKGDRFSIGPGYATPFYYSRKNGEEGIWEWKNKNLQEERYGLYLYGLNDSIDTTEFLEENYNPALEVHVYNYDTETFEQLPLGEERYGAVSEKPYRYTSATGRYQYEKSDGVFCGIIGPEHISANGGVKIKIIPHNLENAKCSGFAWFDYVFLAPGAMNGKININTASERVLQAMKGITPALASNIEKGMDRDLRPNLKPYKNVSDVLDVKNMTPEIFTRIGNLITTRSDQFRVLVIAQTLEDSDGDGTYDGEQGDKILAQSELEKVVDRQELTDGDPATAQFKIISNQ